MSGYTYHTKSYEEKLMVTAPYNIFNIIKNVNGTAHYFFNGFSRIDGTNEIVINLIRANKTCSEYANIMYDGKRNDIKFSEKYKFINFNDIDNNQIKDDIVEAIELKDYPEYVRSIKNTATLFDSDLMPFKRYHTIPTNKYNYINEADFLNNQLEKITKNYVKVGNITFNGSSQSSGTTINYGDLHSGGDLGDNNLFYNSYEGKFNVGTKLVEGSDTIIISNHRRKKDNKIILPSDEVIVL